MTAAAVVALIQGIASGIPKIVAAVEAGRNLEDIRLDEYVSEDALKKIREANARAEDFIRNG